jgi:hypothetical protein
MSCSANDDDDDDEDDVKSNALSYLYTTPFPI